MTKHRYYQHLQYPKEEPSSNTSTVEFASAVPDIEVIVVLRKPAAGSVIVGVPGAVISMVKLNMEIKRTEIISSVSCSHMPIICAL